MSVTGQDSLKTRRTLDAAGQSYDYFSLEAASEKLGDVSRLPYSLKVLLENMLRYEDGRTVTTDDAKALADWLKEQRSPREIAYRPARVLMQDFTGVPAVVDLAAMRDAVDGLDCDPRLINPLSPVDLVIDHSVMVDHSGDEAAFAAEIAREVVGSDNVEDDVTREMGAEDFSYMLQARPGAFLFLGQGEGAGLHQAGYNFNDAVAPVGASFFARLVERAQPAQG